MKRQRYMGANEFTSFIKLGVMCGEANAMLPFVKEDDWRMRIESAVSNLDRVMIERLACLELEHLAAFKRKHENSHYLMQTSDQNRVRKGTPENEVAQVDIDSLRDMAELALYACMMCKEGEVVEGCRFRKAMHNLGIDVCRPDVEPGKCEYKFQDGIVFSHPHMKEELKNGKVES